MNSRLGPLILLILGIGLFFTFTNGQYAKVKELKVKSADYKVAREKSIELLKKRDDLIKKFNNIDQGNIAKLERVIPDTVDSVRLIIDINGITERYGVKVQNVELDALGDNEKKDQNGTVQIIANDKLNQASLRFGISSSYENFVKIIRDIESSLRILDISELSFESDDSGVYDFDLTIKTYWMK